MNISFHKKAALAAAFALTTTAAIAPAPAYAYSQPIYLEINQSYYLPQVSPIKRVAVTNPDIADVIVIDKNAINVVAKKSGSTSLTIWTANGMRQEFTISVTGADSGLGAAIQKAIGLPHVEVTVVGENVTVVLNGKTILATSVKDLPVDGTTPDGKPHPGLHNPAGYIGFLGHTMPVRFRNIEIKEL